MPYTSPKVIAPQSCDMLVDSRPFIVTVDGTAYDRGNTLVLRCQIFPDPSRMIGRLGLPPLALQLGVPHMFQVWSREVSHGAVR